MRGKGKQTAEQWATRRITPAYAGKSVTVEGRITKRRDHPRICGEKAGADLECGGVLGSPPHMRGKDIPRIKDKTGAGITPAYAGKS